MESALPDVRCVAIQPDDVWLLCSDGLTGQVHGTDLLQLVAALPSPHEICERLVNAANLAGGQDNVTVVAIQVSSVDRH